MNPKIVTAVNKQIKLEFESAFLYLAFSGNLRQYGLPGMGHWMREQFREECGHALRFVSHLENRRARVIIPAVNAPVYEWEKPLDLFRMALEHERRITASIHELLTLCREEKEYATQCLLFDYVLGTPTSALTKATCVASSNTVGTSGISLSVILKFGSVNWNSERTSSANIL